MNGRRPERRLNDYNLGTVPLKEQPITKSVSPISVFAMKLRNRALQALAAAIAFPSGM
jgi:hypothetical protein